MRIVFMGTPDFAAGILEAVAADNHHEIAGVVTVADKAAGRGMKIQSSAVKRCAEKYNIPVLQPEKLRDESFINALRNLNADVFLVVAFRMLPKSVWEIPPKGTINLHASLLPQYRGAAPINWAIINGETQTGVTTFFINERIDEGNLILAQEVPILQEDDAGSLHDKLLDVGKGVVLETLKQIENGTFSETKQLFSEEIPLKTAPKLHKEDCMIDWSKTAEEVFHFIRGLSPYPGAFTRYKNKAGEESILKIFSADFVEEMHHFDFGLAVTDGKKKMQIFCKNGSVLVKSLQIFGKKRMPTCEFLLGNKHFDNILLY
ncbi:MAG: methionyl-tRNA formyltransferase [Lentimicrobiaceae bacterium]|nr:methionyl-tRNA formyltransferase [Lentimicrobiaceae bacterium]